MKSFLLFTLLYLPFLSHSQITFEEVTSPEDFNLSAIRQSPTGEYFVQALNDKQGIFTSMNGQDWTRQVLPVKQTLGEIQFFSDGTPLLKSDNTDHLIRRNGSWYTMDIGGYGNIQATFIKDDTLFAYQNDMFAYSLDKGKSFTTVFTSSQLIIDHTAHLWKFDHHFVLHHTAGASDSLSVYTENGVRVLYKGLNVGSPVFTYNSCGHVLINDASNYYLLKEQGLNYTSGLTKNIMNNYSSSSDLQSQGGNYYLRTGKTIFKSSGCNFSWTILENSDFISSYDNMWVNPQADIFLYDNRSDVFEEEPNGTNTWTEHTLDINYALVSSLDESTQDRQFAITSNALFRKNVSDPNWTELDSSANTGYQIQYAPNGDLYINRRSDILYSTDNGQSFSTITLPEDQILPGDYIMHVLDDHILFIIGGLLGQCYYTVNNGQDWIAVPLSFFIDLPKVKLVDNYILIADLDYAYDVYRIDLATNAVTSVHLGDYFPLDYYGSAILDDGTIYFQGFDTNGGHPDGLYRYRIGEGLHYLGAFDELIYLDELFSSGTDLLGFGSSEYYVLEEDTVTTHPYSGLPSGGSKSFYIAENEYLYVTIDNHRIFRSTRPLTYNYHVTGSVYHHTAQDCDVDTLDSTLQYWKVKIENHDYMRIKMSDAKGHFDFAVPAGDYSLSTLPLTSNWDVCEPSFVVSVDDHIPHMNQDFLAKGLNDCAELELDFSTPLLRRCFNNYYSIRVRNTGPAASAGTSLTLELDPYFEFTSATIPYELVGDSIVNFDLGILAVNDEIDFQIFFKLSCDAPLGLEHCLTGELKDDHICGHERSTYVECQNNIGSIDPNDKRIFNEAGKEATTIDRGEYIYYHIRFQNTGTDTAFNIHITDPLSPTLDLSTLEILSASHPYRYSINDGPDLVVDFDNILLPDSSINEAASHGYFKFRVKPRAEYDYGTIIPNQAHIYFDFNDPVLTNEAILLISPKVGTKEPNDFVEFSLFPNPVKTTLALTISAGDRKRVDQYEIIDQLGQTIIQSSFEDGHAIDVSRLSPGIYSLVLKVHGERSGMKRFVRL